MKIVQEIMHKGYGGSLCPSKTSNVRIAPQAVMEPPLENVQRKKAGMNLTCQIVLAIILLDFKDR